VKILITSCPNLFNGPALCCSRWAPDSSPEHGDQQIGILQQLPVDDCLWAITRIGTEWVSHPTGIKTVFLSLE